MVVDPADDLDAGHRVDNRRGYPIGCCSCGAQETKSSRPVRARRPPRSPRDRQDIGRELRGNLTPGLRPLSVRGEPFDLDSHISGQSDPWSSISNRGSR